MKRKIIFIGWDTDYDKVMIKNFGALFHAYNMVIPNILIKAMLKLRLYPIFNFFLSKMISLLLVSDDVVIFKDNILYRDYVSGLDCENKFMLIRNTISNNSWTWLSKLSNSCTLLTFDVEDSIKYEINCYQQFYIYNCVQDVGDKKDIIDIFFLGLDKGRALYINRFLDSISSLDVNVEVYIPDLQINSTLSSEKSVIRDKLTYFQNIEKVSRSKVILDINKGEQVGLTLRVFESLFFQKKLITNNTKVSELPFYNENNILIIDFGLPIDISKVEIFLDSDHVDTSSYVSKYTPVLAIESILKELGVQL
ncbi:hypothetical protein AB4154_10480 [Vibrio sp. 10N.286.51.B11]|uniref:hypothetical protein n=1 Tax=Vibrio sp. 10N.286.51.B11 TaxID=3229706 RepID=UPI00354E3F2F